MRCINDEEENIGHKIRYKIFVIDSTQDKSNKGCFGCDLQLLQQKNVV